MQIPNHIKSNVMYCYIKGIISWKQTGQGGITAIPFEEQLSLSELQASKIYPDMMNITKYFSICFIL